MKVTKQYRFSSTLRNERGERRTKTELLREVGAILTAAGWQLREPSEIPSALKGDILAFRTDLGRMRCYAIDCVLEINEAEVMARIGRSRKLDAGFEELWLVGYGYDAQAAKKIDDDILDFRVLDLNELRRIMAPSHQGVKSKARTKIGKALEANEKEINLAVAGLVLQIEAKIEALQGERPNSDEAIAERNAHITEYTRMRTELEHIRMMVAAFKRGTENETNVVRSLRSSLMASRNGGTSVTTQSSPKRSTWDCFTTAVGVCSMAGAGGKMAVAVSAVLVGGKPAAQALKGLIPKRPWPTRKTPQFTSARHSAADASLTNGLVRKRPRLCEKSGFRECL